MKLAEVDRSLLFIALGLMGYGLLTLYSAGQTDVPTHAAGVWYRQFIWFGVGAVVGSIVFHLSLRLLEWLAPALYLGWDGNVRAHDVWWTYTWTCLTTPFLLAMEGFQPRLFGVLLRTPVPHGVGDEVRHEIDHHHAAVRGEELKYVIGNIARMIDQRACGRMGEDHRSARGSDRILHRCWSHVAKIHEHADPVHLMNDGDAEWV